ncbi:hypothetical protein Ccrd_014139, partial [Cynara cardunculus var. scolymus]
LRSNWSCHCRKGTLRACVLPLPSILHLHVSSDAICSGNLRNLCNITLFYESYGTTLSSTCSRNSMACGVQISSLNYYSFSTIVNGTDERAVCFTGKTNMASVLAYHLSLAKETTNGGIPPGLGQTRLGRLVSAGGRQLLEKLNSARKNFPMKVFLLLLGFYTANALATILGQTGDWDVLVAGVVVAAIEGIGMLMYKKSATTSNNNNNNNNSNRSKRFESLVVMINYWKAGVCLGLFVDAF